MAGKTSRSGNLKEKALELLEWTLADMSPDPAQPLHFKCGFEREGHFIPPGLVDRLDSYGDRWQIPHQDAMKAHAEKFQQRMEGDPRLQRVYCDTAGTFMLEAVTRPLGLAEATQAIGQISDAMVNHAQDMGFSAASFGPLPAEGLMQALDAQAKRLGLGDNLCLDSFVDYSGEVFRLPEGDTLVGRGQHCNLSLNLGGRNLFEPKDFQPTDYKHELPDDYRTGNELAFHAAAKALEWLPHMFLPCRRGNYHRIAAESMFGLSHFSIGMPDSNKTGHVMRHVADRDRQGLAVPGSFRLEFRQGAAEADPYDIALASAVPLVKACDEVLDKQDGKFRVDAQGRPVLARHREFPAEYHAAVPDNEAGAKALFNPKDNPYFQYLDELAQRRIARAQEECRAHPGPRASESLRRAKEFEGIGTALLRDYCREYGMESLMPEGNGGIRVARKR